MSSQLCQIGEVLTGEGFDLPLLKNVGEKHIPHSFVGLYTGADIEPVPSAPNSIANVGYC